MQPIVIPFEPSSLGRVVFLAQVMTGNRKTLNDVIFKLDSGSDFTTLSCDDLDVLGYDDGELRLLELKNKPSLSSGEKPIQIYTVE